jgi:membrane protein DedA with SNARE-associated domain
MTGIEQVLLHYEYPAIFALLMLGIVGPLIPDETILVLSGILVHAGHMKFLPALAAGTGGSICGISLSYAIGLYGYESLDRVWPKAHRFIQEHIIKAERWFRRFGKWTLFFGYFVAGVRHFTALFAGISRMPYGDFWPYAYAGAFCWALSFLSIGYFTGSQWSKIGGTVDRVILVAAAAIVVCGFAWWKIRSRRAS